MNAGTFRALGITVFVVLFSWPARSEEGDPGLRGKLNDGYSLLYDLCDEEKPLDLILIVKTTPANVASFAKAVSQEAGSDVGILQDLQSRDRYLRLDKASLPRMELEVRDSIKAEKQHQLLFEFSGSDYTQLLLVSQIEAATYASNIAKVLATQETSPERTKVLTKMSMRWAALRHRAAQLLKDQ